jgi:molybdopterin converting factor small subunit
MNVHAQFFAQLRDVMGTSALDVELTDGATVAELLEKLYAQAPSLAEWDKTILVGAGVEFVERDHILVPNEEIAIMPPVQGG